MEITMLMIGLLLGGCIMTALLCCLQLNRISGYEAEIQRLKEKLNTQPNAKQQG